MDDVLWIFIVIVHDWLANVLRIPSPVTVDLSAAAVIGPSTRVPHITFGTWIIQTLCDCWWPNVETFCIFFANIQMQAYTVYLQIQEKTAPFGDINFSYAWMIRNEMRWLAVTPLAQLSGVQLHMFQFNSIICWVVPRRNGNMKYDKRALLLFHVAVTFGFVSSGFIAVLRPSFYRVVQLISSSNY